MLGREEKRTVIPYPQIDPEIVAVGPLRIRWYGLMYVLGFLAAYALIPRQPKARRIGLSREVVPDLIFFLAVGLVAGARLGYLLFYQAHNWTFYLEHPLEIIATWHGGMSFHGGLVGAVLAGWIFCRRRGLPFWAVADCVVVTAPVGLGLGRIGNFINGELFGRPTQVPWAMVFPGGGAVPRHPSQLYEALFEGLVLFVILWLLSRKDRWDGFLVAAFLFFYGLFRFILEYFREPDPQLGFVLATLTMGQLLCLGMMAIAAGLYAYGTRRYGVE
jgi:phosphatidylglycerol:prolipoprotein diacylglycerol transferase